MVWNVFLRGEDKSAGGEGTGGECGCRCGFNSELVVRRDEERDLGCVRSSSQIFTIITNMDVNILARESYRCLRLACQSHSRALVTQRHRST